MKVQACQTHVPFVKLQALVQAEALKEPGPAWEEAKAGAHKGS